MHSNKINFFLRGLYVHRPGPDGPPALPYQQQLGPDGI